MVIGRASHLVLARDVLSGVWPPLSGVFGGLVSSCVWGFQITEFGADVRPSNLNY